MSLCKRDKPFYIRHSGKASVIDRSHEAQEYRASGLNLVTAAIVYWNSIYWPTPLRIGGHKANSPRTISSPILHRLDGSTSRFPEISSGIVARATSRKPLNLAGKQQGSATALMLHSAFASLSERYATKVFTRAVGMEWHFSNNTLK